MKLLTVLTALAATAYASVLSAEAFQSPASNLIRQSIHPGWGHKDNWGCDLPKHRRTVTIRASRNDKDDISDEFLRGIKKANRGGTLWLKKGQKYVIGKKLDLTFLKDVHVRLDGEIKFTDDIKYWQANHFYYDFQKSITFWVWGGEKIRIYGNGVLNGNGQAWWNGFAGKEILDPDNVYLRPILFMTDNATDVSVEGIEFKDSPCWNTFMVRTNDIAFDNVKIEAVSNNASVEPKNSDGWDTLNVKGISVTNSWVNIGDDCFSPKPNTSDIFVQNLWCNGTHGVSMGSIGQYPGVLDYIENAYIENVTMLNAEQGGRLKPWAGPNKGYGYIRNITFKNFEIGNTDWPIILDSCYFNVDSSTCAEYPSKVNVTDITFDNFHGKNSGKYWNIVGKLICSPDAVCENITIKNKNTDLTGANGEEGVFICEGISQDIGVPCVSWAEFNATRPDA